MSHFFVFCLGLPPPCYTPKCDKLRAGNESKFDVNFRFHIFLELAYITQKVLSDEQLYQNENEVMMTRHSNQIKYKIERSKIAA